MHRAKILLSRGGASPCALLMLLRHGTYYARESAIRLYHAEDNIDKDIC